MYDPTAKTLRQTPTFNRQVSRGRELLGELADSVDSRLGYAERAVANIASGLLQLATPDGGSAERDAAKQRLSKALKLAHGRLQNHQLVSQVLLFMAPLQVRATIRRLLHVDLSAGCCLVVK
jgi:hypothetical protein